MRIPIGRGFSALRAKRLIDLFLFQAWCYFCICGLTSCMPEKSLPIYECGSGFAKTSYTINMPERLAALPLDSVPWGGVVSHHGVTAPLLDEYFRDLCTVRDIDTFYLIAPSHFGLSNYFVSITGGSWETEFGLLRSDRKKAAALAQNLAVPFDDAPFFREHGISAICPFIKKYFPNAKIVPIAYDVVNNFSGAKMKILAEKVKSAFLGEASDGREAAKRDKTFLLLSSDFSHHGDLETTQVHDARTAEFFASPFTVSVWKASCDNIPALLAFQKLCTKKTQVLTVYQTNSLAILPAATNPNDITSYFFSYFLEAVDLSDAR